MCQLGKYLLFFAAGVGLCLLHRPTELPFTFDNQIYFYISERVASGVAPHVALVDHKFALSSMISGAAIALGRLGGIGDVVSLRMLSVAVASGTVALVAALAFQLMRGAAAAAVAGLVMLSFNDFFLQGAMGARPKIFVVFFTAVALYMAVREKHFCAGLAAGAATLCWQPAFFVPLSLLVADAASRDRKTRLARLIAGGATILCAYEAYFVWQHALADQLLQSFVMAADSTTKGRTAGDTLAFVVGEGARRQGIVKAFPVVFLVTIAAAIPWAAVRFSKVLSALLMGASWAGPVICAYLALAYTAFDHQSYPDRFVLYPFMALCGAWVVTRISASFRTQRLASAVVAVAIVASSVVVAMSVHVTKERGVTLADQYALADEVAELTERHGSLWALNCVHLLALNRQANHTPYGVLFDARIRRLLQGQLEGRPYLPLKDGELPGVILISRTGEFKAIRWLPMAYRQEKRRAFERQGIRLWVYEGFKPAPNAGSEPGS